MSRVFWDTNLFIYLIEGHDDRADRVAALRERMLERGDQLVTSALTLGEVLVRPLEAGQDDLAAEYRNAITTGAEVIPFDEETAVLYAGVRQDRGIRPPDAIQLASAARARTDLFVTNDERLSRKSAPNVQFITSLERAFV